MTIDKPVCKIATLERVRERTEGSAVEVWLTETGKTVIRAYNECGNNFTDVDAFDLLAWFREGPLGKFDHGTASLDSEAVTTLSFARRN